MDLATWVNLTGDDAALAIGGFLIGAVFGASAQQSRFCLRSAVIEFSQGRLREKAAIWAIAFATAVTATQGLVALQWLDVSGARQLASQGSMSGALIGGAMFGCGMILARGCASRLLVLSATGNLRALVSGLILTLVAQASLRGVLSPAREALSAIWVVDGGNSRNLLALLGAGTPTGLALGLLWLAIGTLLAWRSRVAPVRVLGTVGVGLTIAAGWLFTYSLSEIAFTPVALKSISFSGPSADTLMSLINAPTLKLGFDTGLVPGVFFGSMIAALIAGEMRIESYSGGASMVRYIVGAALMGFGSMLAGGCAVGAGVTGGSIFATTAWLALAAMWFAATLTSRLVESQ